MTHKSSRTLRSVACFIFGAGTVVSLVAACKGRVSVSRTAYILGPVSNIKAFGKNAPEAVTTASSSVVLILTHLDNGTVKFCSGTLVAPEKGSKDIRVLSNHHCFADANHDDGATPGVLPEACSKTTVYFGFTTDKAKANASIRSSPCKEGSLRTHFNADLSVFALKEPPPEDFHPMALYAGDDFPTGRNVLIVHYPDIPENDAVPSGERFKVPTLAYTSDNCSIIGAFSTEEWLLDHSLPFGLRHSCDLVHGSSGSALVDAETKTLIGVNWGGIKIRYEDGVQASNAATRAYYARAFLDNNMAVFDKPVEPAGKDLKNKGFIDANAPASENAQGKSEPAPKKKGLCGVFGKSSDQNGFFFALPLIFFLRRRR